MATFEQIEKRILVVDDSPDNLYLMQLVLETEGYRVSLANSGKEALQKITIDRPHLILLDVMMPQMNGFEVVDRLQQDDSLASIPVCFVTADKYIQPQEAIAAGANGVIYKPVDFNELLVEIEAIWARVRDLASHS